MASRVALAITLLVVLATAGSTATVDLPQATPARGTASNDSQALNDSKATNDSQGSSAPALQRALGTETVPGLDVSAYQHGVNWKKAYALGARFAYIKATEGDTYTSARFVEQYTGARKAGLIRGAFHFAKPNRSTAVAQATYFVKALEKVGGAGATGSWVLPPLVDLEYDPYTKTDKTDSCWGLSPKQMVLWIRSYTDTIVSLTGRLPVIYTTTNWWATCTGDSDYFAQDDLFVARYVATPLVGAGAVPSAWPSWTIWQHTSTGTTYAGITDGSKGDVPASDEDLFAGSMADLRAFARSEFAGGTGLSPGRFPLPGP